MKTATAIIVRFNDVDEFLNELARGPATLDGILRVTMQFKQSAIHPNIEHISVIAGVLRQYDDALQLIQLMRYCGDSWGKEFDRKAIMRAEEIIAKLEEQAPRHALAVRAGLYKLPARFDERFNENFAGEA